MLGRPRDFAERLLKWYDRDRRELPWRTPRGQRTRLDPYGVLVSEMMLQQTQVATVIPYFERFIQRFPTLEELARAREQEVLRLWQGLGYYSRARNLLATAGQVVARHGGRLPQTVAELRSLPGIGRYTAGAIASIAFDARAPVVDGNVARVLCRLDRIESDPRGKATQELLWRRALEILPTNRCGDFNSATMELGAMICTPRGPQCPLCPVSRHCEAIAAGVQEAIPPPRKAKPIPLLHRDVLCIRRGQTWLIEQRPESGRWAGMWQFVTVSRSKNPRVSGLTLTRPSRLGTVKHALTHRRYTFRVLRCERTGGEVENESRRAWVSLEQLDQYPLPRPHVKIAQVLRTCETVGPPGA